MLSYENFFYFSNVTGYILDEDVNKFMKILLSLRKSIKNIKSLARNYYKVTRDPEFEDIK